MESSSIFGSRSFFILLDLEKTLLKTSADGALVFSIFALLAQHERGRLQERTVAGLYAARARGRMGGRPVKHTDEKKQLAKTLLRDSTHTIKDVSRPSAFHLRRFTIFVLRYSVRLNQHMQKQLLKLHQTTEPPPENWRP
ncbi:MAG: recombinase family protein [Oligoflexus sp.]|nr:recombinase family protein [Oligoflexus sp.]